MLLQCVCVCVCVRACVRACVCGGWVGVCVCVCEKERERKRERERERERDFYVNGKTCLPFLGHKTAIRSYYQ